MVVQTQFFSGQGLGNQLWVYSSGRGIAEYLQRSHVVTGRDQFKGHGIVDIDWGDEQQIIDAKISVFREEAFYDPQLRYFASDYDRGVENLGPMCRVDGNLQSERYFFGRTNKLRNWVRPTHIIKEAARTYADRIVLNVRGGEYKRHKQLILPKSYWEHALHHLYDRTGDKNPIIVTDDPRYVRTIFPKFDIVTGIEECWAALYGAKAIAVSNSSFAYFPIKTRKVSPLVIAPMHWSRYGNVYGRWASPANYCEDWNWLSVDGNLVDATTCKSVIDATRSYYGSFKIRAPDIISVRRPITSLIPVLPKKIIKLFLSLIFPSKF